MNAPAFINKSRCSEGGRQGKEEFFPGERRDFPRERRDFSRERRLFPGKRTNPALQGRVSPRWGWEPGLWEGELGLCPIYTFSNLMPTQAERFSKCLLLPTGKDPKLPMMPFPDCSDFQV